jgi:hypothetical protein
MKKGVLRGCVAHFKDMRNEYILVGKPQPKQLLGKSKKDNFKMKLREIIRTILTGCNWAK